MIGVFDFLTQHKLIANPRTLVYKSYTDDLRTAYWLAIDILHPWENRPGAVRATRDLESNTLTLEVAKLRQVTVDLNDVGMSLGESFHRPHCPLGGHLLYSPGCRLGEDGDQPTSCRHAERQGFTVRNRHIG